MLKSGITIGGIYKDKRVYGLYRVKEVARRHGISLIKEEMVIYESRRGDVFYMPIDQFNKHMDLLFTKWDKDSWLHQAEEFEPMEVFS